MQGRNIYIYIYLYAPNLKLTLLKLFEAALVPASWRVALHGSQRDAPHPLRLACCARWRVVVYRCRGIPPNPPFSAALGLTAALGFLVRVSVLCDRSRGRPPTLLLLSLSLLSGISMRRRIMLSYSKTPATLREQLHCTAILGAWPAALSAGARPVEYSALPN